VSDPEFNAYIAEMQMLERELIRLDELLARSAVLPPGWMASGGTDEHLAALAHRDDANAHERLVSRYTGLVRLKAARYLASAERYTELVEAGLTGLNLAIRHYRPERDGRFQDIAALCIGGQMEVAANRR
jgi:hypothetical protein